MKTQHVLICIFTASVAVMAWGGNAIEPVAQVPMVEVDSIPMEPSCSGVWDFSGLRILSGRKYVTLDKVENAMLVLRCDDNQLTYVERDDSLFWSAFENPGTEMRQPYQHHAIRPTKVPYSGSIDVPIAFCGRFSDIKNVSLLGTVHSKCDARGAISAGRDTIGGVTRERQLLEATFAADGAEGRGELAVLRHRWFIPGADLPVAESNEITIRYGRQDVVRRRTCYVSGTLARASKVEIQRARASRDSRCHDGRMAIDEVSATGGVLTVKTDFPPEAAGERYEIIVTDLLGRVHGTASGIMGTLPVEVEIVVGPLPSGRYLVEMTAGKSQAVKMLTVK